ncbi:helix-turn-helix domain-containing protein [Sphingomicrobium aestuariivivum]|uniref:helix-turn-helix domain-containing protein n=1 Tax=Sphingomicrobium aestuariivivum TaxID=1582356 RepID=UPI001FD71867|nr:helix-turn-helix domain-containing protein [Sphingomicrobium aestuariivivum]MCJ8191523.1 helix-turn-helix domain-containing protein [Sphingomicrobium aestuariivivum]
MAGGIGLTLSRATVAPDDLPEHGHEEAHCVLAIDGGYQSRAMRDDPAAAGFAVYNPPGTIHRDRFFETGGRFLALDLPLELIDRGGDPGVLDRAGGAARLMAMVGPALEWEADAPLQVEAQALELVASIETRHDATRRPAWFDRAHRALEAAAEMPGGDVRQAAHDCAVHPVHFARVWRRETGEAPARSLTLFRVRRAMALLGKDRSLGEIAHECGFSDQAHLTRSLRRFTGTTPRRLQRQFS